MGWTASQISEMLWKIFPSEQPGSIPANLWSSSGFSDGLPDVIFSFYDLSLALYWPGFTFPNLSTLLPLASASLGKLEKCD